MFRSSWGLQSKWTNSISSVLSAHSWKLLHLKRMNSHWMFAVSYKWLYQNRSKLENGQTHHKSKRSKKVKQLDGKQTNRCFSKANSGLLPESKRVCDQNQSNNSRTRRDVLVMCYIFVIVLRDSTWCDVYVWHSEIQNEFRSEILSKKLAAACGGVEITHF